MLKLLLLCACLCEVTSANGAPAIMSSSSESDIENAGATGATRGARVRGGCGRGAGATRGVRVRGMGERGRAGGSSGPALTELELVRKRRQETKKRIGLLPPHLRKELGERKFKAELQRVILPDAPAKKRRTGRESPEREACEFVASSRIQILEDIQLVAPCAPENDNNMVEHLEIQDIQLVAPRAPENDNNMVENVEIQDIQLVAPRAPENDNNMVENLEILDIAPNDMDVGSECEVRTAVPSTSGQRISTGISDKNFNQTIDEWMRYVDDMSDDDDDNFMIDDSEPCSLPTLTPRDASAEPASENDLTSLQATVLTDEDRLNDLAVRDIVPSDDCYTFNWKGDKHNFAGQRETFDMTSGPTFEVTDQTSVVDVFYKMFDSDFIDLLCTQTNLYASQKIAMLRNSNNLRPNSRLHRWTPTDRDEMISFLAIGILQGLYPLPEEESYFSFNGFGTMPYFSKIMSYNRYLLLKSLLHFTDNETLTESSKLTKIQPVTDYLNDKFSSLYIPSREIVIDESLLKWHGRLGFAQKILSKAAQVGVKTYELCESASGYLWKFFVYAGKDKRRITDTQNETNDDDETETMNNDDTREILATATATDTQPTNATAKIVYQLVTPLLDRGHTLIMDNFYNSPLLVRCLKRRKTDCFGTLRLNREFVPDSLKTLKQSDLRQGEIVASYCSDITVMAWRDAKIVSMISTFHRLQIGTTDKYDRLKYKPNIVLDYNKSMGGVDRKDQFLSAQPMERVRNKVWYKKLFRRLFNTAVFNCFVIYSTAHRNVSHRQFRTILAEDLLKRHRQVDLTTEPRLALTRTGLTAKPSTSTRPKLTHKHFPVKTGTKWSRCSMCAQQKVTTRTVWKCLQCDVNLCIEGCFMAYHT